MVDLDGASLAPLEPPSDEVPSGEEDEPSTLSGEVPADPGAVQAGAGGESSFEEDESPLPVLEGDEPVAAGSARRLR